LINGRRVKNVTAGGMEPHILGQVAQVNPRPVIRSLMLAWVLGSPSLACSAGTEVFDGGAEDAGGALADAGDGGETDAGPGYVYKEAPHPPFPTIPDLGGPTFANPRLVTVTFPGYSRKDDVEAFGDWIDASEWLSTVGSDYGIQSATHPSKIVLSDPAPAQIIDEMVQELLAA